MGPTMVYQIPVLLSWILSPIRMFQYQEVGELSRLVVGLYTDCST